MQISKEFPDVKWDKELVDAATVRMVSRPATLDTLVATNLHADILSDLGVWAAEQVSEPHIHRRLPKVAKRW